MAPAASASENASENANQGNDNAAAAQSASDSSSDQAASHAVSGTAGTSGDVKSPQPIGNADDNAGGANGQCPGGPYCSTRDGSPSLNGNGNGEAVGKPCAGCVGKADNKNPNGQMPNGSDHNAGYECDRNHGIGRSNPAHTGCKAPVTVTPPTVTPPTVTPPTVTPPTVTPPTVTPPTVTPPTVRPPTVRPPAVTPPPAEVLPEEEVAPPINRPRPPAVLGVEETAPTGVLPAAGAPDRMGLTGAGGAALMLMGGITLWLQRRTRQIG